MKPPIILIRHGESEGNVNPNLYSVVPDHRISLTELGFNQAKSAKDALSHILARYPGDPHFYTSPYLRAKQTAQNMLPEQHLGKLKQDPRLREQEWGVFQDPEDLKMYKEQRKEVGHFFYRFPNGESGADVYDRCSAFLETVFRDLNSRYGPVVCFTHGLTMRILSMRLMHTDVEEFESWDNPPNCHITVIDRVSGRYDFVEGEFEKWAH